MARSRRPRRRARRRSNASSRTFRPTCANGCWRCRTCRTRACRSGASEADNVEVRRWGTPKDLALTPRDHVDVGAAVGGLDFEISAKLAGVALLYAARRRCTTASRAGAAGCSTRTSAEHGYIECYVPYIVNRDDADGTGQLPKFEDDLFWVTKGGAPDEARMYLIPTAEVPLTNFVRDQIVPRETLAAQVHRAYAVLSLGGGKLRQGHARHDPRSPIRQGRAGADRPSRRVVRRARGAGRSRRSDSAKARAAVPRRAACARATPALRRPRPTISKSGFRARAGTGRFRRARIARPFRRGACRRDFATRRARPELVHTLNGSALAVGRTLVAVLENYQRADGGVDIPAVLQAVHGRA